MSNGNQPYSRDTYQDLARKHHFVSVRFKQGVPLVDADLNEAEDIRRNELCNFLRWFVGDGVPNGNDGFGIQALAAADPDPANDVRIHGGDGSWQNAGRYLVDGLEVLIDSSLRFSQQPAGTKLPPPPTAAESRTDLLYLDVWEEDIGAAECPDIVDERIGLETARRIRRQWAVRVAEGGRRPAEPIGHAYVSLAEIVRHRGKDIIKTQDIRDLRRTQVAVPSVANFRQITADAFGEYDLRENGQPQLARSLRTVLNGVLRNWPAVSGPEPVEPTQGDCFSQTSTSDIEGCCWLFWIQTAGPEGGEKRYDVTCSRSLPSSDQQPPGLLRWSPPETVATLGKDIAEYIRRQGGGLAVTTTSDGTVWLFCIQQTREKLFNLQLRRRRSNGQWQEPVDVVPAARDLLLEQLVAATNNDDEVMVVWMQNRRIRSSCFGTVRTGDIKDIAIGADSNPANTTERRIALLPEGLGFRLLLAERVTTENIWQVKTARWADDAWGPISATAATNLPAAALNVAAAWDRFGVPWMVWTSAEAERWAGMYAKRLLQPEFTQSLLLYAETMGEGRAMAPCLSYDPDGNIQVFCSLVKSGGGSGIYRFELTSKV